MTPSNDVPKRASPVDLITLWLAGILAGGVLGAVTNAVNAQVSPLYFRNIMRWQEVAQIMRAIIAQGIFEGLICGYLISTVFTAVIGVIARGACSIFFGLRYLGLLLGIALTTWAIGGLLAMMLAALSPEFYASHFIGVPEEFGARLRYAWVGGSIWGVQFGGAAGMVIAAVIFRAAWIKRA